MIDLSGLDVEERDGITYSRDHATDQESEFLQHYRSLRDAEGRGSEHAAWYLSLPNVDSHHPRAREWRERANTLAWITSHLSSRASGSSDPLSILDAGAGNCWLSWNLALLGHAVVALDLNDDPRDGLRAGRHYLENGRVTFGRLCSSYSTLPLHSDSADSIIFNASLHYALNLNAVIAESVRVLAPGGEILVVDSPFYRHREDGELMVRQREEKGRATYLTYSAMKVVAEQNGLETTYVERKLPRFSSVRRALQRIRLGRAPASMPHLIMSRVEDARTTHYMKRSAGSLPCSM